MRTAEQTGARAVELAKLGEGINKILTEKAIENAMRVLLALGGSTNGIVHLAAIAGRLGLSVDLNRLDQMSRETPVLVNLKPTGQFYMEDFHKAGGVQALLRELRPLLHLDALSVSGQCLGDIIDQYDDSYNTDVIRPLIALFMLKAVSLSYAETWPLVVPLSNNLQQHLH